MPERQASTTAIVTAIMRAAHQILDAHPKILDDPVAIGLVEGSSEAAIRAQEPDLQPPLKRLVWRVPWGRGSGKRWPWPWRRPTPFAPG
jgi:O-methyltransferase involved in polyketide biosynthesis